MNTNAKRNANAPSSGVVRTTRIPALLDVVTWSTGTIIHRFSFESPRSEVVVTELSYVSPSANFGLLKLLKSTIVTGLHSDSNTIKRTLPTRSINLPKRCRRARYETMRNRQIKKGKIIRNTHVKSVYGSATENNEKHCLRL